MDKHYVKLDCDDIMEILLEHYQDQFTDSDCAKGILLGTPDNELRFVAVYGNNDDIKTIDLEEVDKEMDYNGDHAFLRNNPEFYLE